MIELKNLSKSFRQGDQVIHVLSNINLQFQDAETVAILGKSGSGKSTLLSLMASFDRPDEGEVLIDGVSLNTLSTHDLVQLRSKKFGFVFQQFHLIDYLSAIENVLLPMNIAKVDGRLEKATELINRVGLAGRSSHFPRQLSGGEKQRVALARALAVSPKIIFADEPTGSLDTETGEKITSLLFDCVKQSGATLILVTHDEDLAKRCDRTVRLEQGLAHL